MEALYVADLLFGLTIEAGPRGVTAIHFGYSETAANCQSGPLVREAEKQLREYGAGARRRFDIPLDPQGTAFQLKVWRALTDIPYGSTVSYRQIAEAVGCARGFQAIGQANHRNPIPVIVPCHRVIAADSSIGGYGGGIERKRQLLDLEIHHAHRVRETAA